MHPETRVRMVVETARAVLDGRVDPDAARTSVEMQAEQLAPMLRTDRLDVTRHEAESVAETLRRLAEQVTDAGTPDDEARVGVAAALGSLAQALR